MKAWLIEVNTSPALTVEGDVDVDVKIPLISDAVDVLNFGDLQQVKAAASSSKAKKAAGASRHARVNTQQTSLRLERLRKNGDSLGIQKDYGQTPIGGTP